MGYRLGQRQGRGMTRVLSLEVLLADAKLVAENQRYDRDRFGDLLDRAALMREEALRLRGEQIAGLDGLR